jgi:N-acetylglutamate synthase-like GNAT family acetyltransferase
MSVVNFTDTVSTDSNCATIPADSLVYRVATKADCDSLVTLINSSYRGELAHQGWTNENKLVSGSRTNTEVVFDMITGGKYLFLVFFGEADDVLKGCINLLHKPESKSACLNTFAMHPNLQARGYGKYILSVAENSAVSNWNVEYTELNVLIQRPELVAYYNRRGYIDTGHHETFSIEQFKSGGALRYDLERCTMRKCVKKNEKNVASN